MVLSGTVPRIDRADNRPGRRRELREVGMLGMDRQFDCDNDIRAVEIEMRTADASQSPENKKNELINALNHAIVNNNKR